MTLDEIKAVLKDPESFSVEVTNKLNQTHTHKFTGLSTKNGHEVMRVEYQDGTYGDIYLTDIQSVSVVDEHQD